MTAGADVGAEHDDIEHDGSEREGSKHEGSGQCSDHRICSPPLRPEAAGDKLGSSDLQQPEG